MVYLFASVRSEVSCGKVPGVHRFIGGPRLPLQTNWYSGPTAASVYMSATTQRQ